MGSFQGVFDHVTIRASDRAASQRFYTTVLAVLGHRPDPLGRPVHRVERLLAGGGHGVEPRHHRPPHRLRRALAASAWTSSGRRASTPATRATASPGRARSTATTTTAASCSTRTGTAPRRSTSRTCTAGVDHLWVRVADVGRSARFYETIAPFAGLREEEREGRAQFAGRGGGLVLGARGDHVTKSLHMAFAAPDDRTVDDFHRRRPRGRLPRQRHPRRALRVPPRLLQRLRARSRRQQRRAGQPQPLEPR